MYLFLRYLAKVAEVLTTPKEWRFSNSFASQSRLRSRPRLQCQVGSIQTGTPSPRKHQAGRHGVRCRTRLHSPPRCVPPSRSCPLSARHSRSSPLVKPSTFRVTRARRHQRTAPPSVGARSQRRSPSCRRSGQLRTRGPAVERPNRRAANTIGPHCHGRVKQANHRAA